MLRYETRASPNLRNTEQLLEYTIKKIYIYDLHYTFQLLLQLHANIIKTVTKLSPHISHVICVNTFIMAQGKGFYVIIPFKYNNNNNNNNNNNKIEFISTTTTKIYTCNYVIKPSEICNKIPKICH